MPYMRFAFLAITSIMLLAGCKRQPANINLEQAHSKTSANIIAPGFGTIGIIKNHEIFVYFLDRNSTWTLDNVSQFQIPENSDGVLSLGMGVMGVLQNNIMNFYYIDAQNNWSKYRDVTFETPENFKRITSMRLPWEIGFIATENRKGIISFYYLDENKKWVSDETANFGIPPDTDDYIMMGGMEIGIIKDNKLGVYQLDDFGRWQFMDDLVLSLPNSFEAVLSYEPGTIAVLKQGRMMFHRLDITNRKWVYDPSMDFQLPV